MAKSPKQIQEEITQRIIESLERGTLPWRKPWSCSPNSDSPTNVVSENAYRGINSLLLPLHQERFGFQSKWYATFKQWRDLGASVDKRPDDVPPGEWGCGIVFYAPVNKTETDPFTGEEIEVESFGVLRQYTVFNAEQVKLPSRLEHLIDFETDSLNEEFVDFAPAEDAITATQANIQFGGDSCFYARATDHIQMVEKQRFEFEKEWYSTCLHELAHWSERRCDWKGNYAEGELRAEMSAAFMCSQLQIPQSDDLTNTEAYLASWLQSLQHDRRFIFRASAAASKAADYVLSFSKQPEPAVV